MLKTLLSVKNTINKGVAEFYKVCYNSSREDDIWNLIIKTLKDALNNQFS